MIIDIKFIDTTFDIFIELYLCCKQRDLIVEMNRFLNVILFEQISPVRSGRKSSAESLVSFFVNDYLHCAFMCR